MKLRLSLVSLFLFSIAFASVSAQAKAPFAGTTAALQTRDHLIAEFVSGRTYEMTYQAINGIVEESLDALQHAGRADLAAHYRKLWERESARLFKRSILGVGDHEPLSDYLSELVDVLKDALGKDSKYYDLVRDVETMNYAIPIVLAPAGEWRTGSSAKDRIEYADHFIPFSGILVYHASLASCRAIAAKMKLDLVGRRLCPSLAGRLEKEMQDRLAPKLATLIFNKVNHVGSFISLRERDYLYRDESALEKGLR